MVGAAMVGAAGTALVTAAAAPTDAGAEAHPTDRFLHPGHNAVRSRHVPGARVSPPRAGLPAEKILGTNGGHVKGLAGTLHQSRAMTCPPRSRTAALGLLLTLGGVLGGATAACSTSFEVGQMNQSEPVTTGGSAMTDPDQGAQAGSDPGSDASDPMSTCEPGQMPAALTGPFAEPAVVWSRIAGLLSDQPLDPPSALPAKTTYDWAGDIVKQAFDQATGNDEPAPGTELFLKSFLFLPDGAEPLSGDWGRYLHSNMPTLEILLLTQLPTDNKRVGIFTEQSWLKQFPQIATRGYVFGNALGVVVPPHPGNITERDIPAPGPNTTRRQAEVSSVSADACDTCHSLIDPLGFSLEHFDAFGNYQQSDAGRPVNSAGTYQVPGSNKELTFDDNLNLSQQLVYVCAANLGMAARYLNMALARSHVPQAERSAAYDANLVRFQEAYVGSGRSYRALITAWAQSHMVLDP